jgi:hypothetical protein
MRAEFSTEPVGSVEFMLDVNYRRVENTPPYALAGDMYGNYNPWIPTVGTHTLTATPYSLSDATGVPSTPLTVTFTVIEG